MPNNWTMPLGLIDALRDAGIDLIEIRRDIGPNG
jgi:hypothetical protein